MSSTAKKLLNLGKVGAANDKDTEQFPLQLVQSLGLISRESNGQEFAAGFKLNGQLRGAFNGKYSTDEWILGDDEFINYFLIKFNKTGMVSAHFRTNKGRSLITGDSFNIGPLTVEERKNVRVIAMGGSFRFDRIAQLEIQYVDDFKSATELRATDELAVTKFLPGGSKVETITSSAVSVLSSELQMTERIVQAEGKFSAKGGGSFAGISASASVSLTVGTNKTTTDEVRDELETERETTDKMNQTVPIGFVGLEVINVKVYEEANGFKWMWPSSDPQFITLPIESELLSEFYDLTTGLTSQVPSLKSRVTEKNGFRFIAASDGSVSFQTVGFAPLLLVLSMIASLLR